MFDGGEVRASSQIRWKLLIRDLEEFEGGATGGRQVLENAG